jgi:hypothetical protein
MHGTQKSTAATAATQININQLFIGVCAFATSRTLPGWAVPRFAVASAAPGFEEIFAETFRLLFA